jgi:hypothetical protein
MLLQSVQKSMGMHGVFSLSDSERSSGAFVQFTTLIDFLSMGHEGNGVLGGCKNCVFSVRSLQLPQSIPIMVR